MKKQLAVLFAALVVVLVLAAQLGRAAAGPSRDDIEDSDPAWSSDGVRLAFDRTGGGGPGRVLQMTSAGRDLQVDSGAGPGALRGWAPGTSYKLVQTPTGETEVTTGDRWARPYAVLHGVDATASPDGTRVAYLRDGTLYAADVDGGGELPLATGVTPPSWDVAGPVWSPDAARIVIASGSSLLLANADGSGRRVLYTGANQSVDPSWSPDGRTVAFENNGGPHWQIWTMAADGSNAHELLGGSAANYRYPVFSPVSDELAYTSDRRHALGGATRYQFALYLRDLSGVSHELVDDVDPYSRPAWSPTAALLAVSAGQECRRWGVYVVRPDVGAHAARRSNPCRFDGTASSERIRGSSFFDIMNGFAGNDAMLGLDGNDKILGENGNDRIAGGNGNDVIFGGPGDDRLYGGPGNDVIVGGPGRDVIDCGPGVDTVEAVQRIDVVARNCEHVRH